MQLTNVQSSATMSRRIPNLRQRRLETTNAKSGPNLLSFNSQANLNGSQEDSLPAKVSNPYLKAAPALDAPKMAHKNRVNIASATVDSRRNSNKKNKSTANQY